MYDHLMNLYYKYFLKREVLPLKDLKQNHLYYNFIIDSGRRNYWFIFKHIFDYELEPPTYLCPANTKLEDLAVLIGICPSKAQARGSGWGGEIGKGYSRLDVKSKYSVIWIFKAPPLNTLDK